MTVVTSPYNFVPAPTEEQVFKPDWADQVSQDIPFEDGESGEIEIEITAETPIFIRNGYSKPKEGEIPTEEFSHFLDKNGKKQFFIPATSIKGMVRNVLEIMSFSRLNKDLVNNSRFSQRDISTSDTQYMVKFGKEKDNLKAGWLVQKKDGSWEILACKEFTFIYHQNLKDKLGINFRDYFLIHNKKSPEKKLDSKFKTAIGKYKELRSISLNQKFSFYEEDVKNVNGEIIDKRKISEISPTGVLGTLVFSGQSSLRYEPIDGLKDLPFGKTREFVFFNSDEPEVFTVPKDVQSDFKFIYNDHDDIAISKDWEYFRDNVLKVGNKVPVFFSPGKNKTVKHFGLAYMYKLPYDFNVHGLNPFIDYRKGNDLAHTIFGFASKEDSLKGRVFFGHAMAQMDTVKINEKPEKEILSSPKASYFPFYLEQFKKDNGGYFTYDDALAILKGFKRYPVRANAISGTYDEKQKQNNKTWSRFRPIQKGAKFRGKIKFHNLKKAELGALLSALTFHNNSDQCNHSLGGAKPYGYGRISLKAGLNILEKQWKFEECLQEHESVMEKHFPNWINSKPISELFSMAILGEGEGSLTYPTTTEYQNYKKREIKREPKQIQKLEDYSTIQNRKPKIKRLVALKPSIKKMVEFTKSGGKVDVKVVGQEGLQMKVEVFLEGMEGKFFQIRYPEGLNYFGKDSIIEADISFPQPNNRKQFNLKNPKRKE